MIINENIHDAMLVAQRFAETRAAAEAARTAVNNLMHASLSNAHKAALCAALEAIDSIKQDHTLHAAQAYLKTL